MTQLPIPLWWCVRHVFSSIASQCFPSTNIYISTHLYTSSQAGSNALNGALPLGDGLQHVPQCMTKCPNNTQVPLIQSICICRLDI